MNSEYWSISVSVAINLSDKVHFASEKLTSLAHVMAGDRSEINWLNEIQNKQKILDAELGRLQIFDYFSIAEVCLVVWQRTDVGRYEICLNIILFFSNSFD